MVSKGPRLRDPSSSATPCSPATARPTESHEELARSESAIRVPRSYVPTPRVRYGIAAILLLPILVALLWSRWPGIPSRHMRTLSGTPRTGTSSNRIPSADELAQIAIALRELLNTYERYKLFLEKPSGPGDNLVPEIAILDCIGRLEHLINPRRLPFGSPELFGYTMRGWPYEVMTAYPKLRKNIYSIIKRWDVPEICQDRPFTRGRYGVTQADGTVKEIDRPPQARTLTPLEREELTWILNALLEALPKAGRVIPPSTDARREADRPRMTCTVMTTASSIRDQERRVSVASNFPATRRSRQPPDGRTRRPPARPTGAGPDRPRRIPSDDLARRRDDREGTHGSDSCPLGSGLGRPGVRGGGRRGDRAGRGSGPLGGLIPRPAL
jgi:hypothetical protein